MTETLVLPTEQDGVILQQFTTLDDDSAYIEAVEENRDHLSRHGDATSRKYKTRDDVTYRRLNAGNELRMGIWADNQLKGGLTATPKKHGAEVEIGYWLRYSAQGNGYATLAVKAITAYLRPQYPRIYAEVHIDNELSAKVMERAHYRATKSVVRKWGEAVVFEPAQET